MLFRTPDRTFLAGLALAAVLAALQLPAFLQDAATFRAALSRQDAAPVPHLRPAQLAAAARHAGAPASPSPASSPDSFARLGAAVLPLIYRVEPDEEPTLPEHHLPGEIWEAAHHLPAGSFALLNWSPDTFSPAAPIAPIALAAVAPAAGPGTPPPDLAPSAYAALEAGAVDHAATLFDRALAAAPSAQLAADLAYARLRLGQRREAAQAFQAALRLGPPTPQADSLWQQEANRLTDRLSVQAYSFLRGTDGRRASPPFSTAAPGQSQSALVAQYRPDPFAERPVVLVGRLLAAHRGAGESPFTRTAQATAGLGWVAAPAINGTLVAERWVRLGEESRDAWVLRAHGGYGEGYGPAEGGTGGDSNWLHWSLFGEVAVVGTRRRDLFAGGEARAGYGFALGPQTRATATAALWALAQHDDRTRHRVEAGPSLGLETVLGGVPVHLRLDYRMALTAARAAGNGLAFTFATDF